jgi:hypothetical protein
MPVSISLAGKGNGKGKEKKSEREAGVSTHVGVDVFVTNERDLIRHHYVTNRGSLPPGLAKRGGDLPPGLQKQLRRNGHLPPGLEKKLYPFPVELERRLPVLRPGLVRGIIGGSAVIVDKRTSLILDVFAVF